MTGEHDEHDIPAEAADAPRPRLQLVCTDDDDLAVDATEPVVRLHREFKGLTVADVTRDEIARRLPGRIRSAIAHLEAGDLAAAERAVPATGGRVLVGPGRRRRRRWSWLWLLAGAALLVGSALARWLVA